MKILFLSRWFPYPADNGSKLRVYHLLRGLAGEHEVHLLSFADSPKTAQQAALQTLCRTVRVVQWREFQATSRRALLGFFNPLPRSLVDTYSVEMEQEIQRALVGQTFDLVITSQWQMTAYRHLFADLPVLFEELEVGLTYNQVQNAAFGAARWRAQLTWWKQRRYLTRLLSDGLPCTVVSEQEKALLSEIAPKSSIHVIPNGVSVAEYSGYCKTPEPDTLIFTGSFRYQPNYEAMLWFVEKILPRIQDKVPNVTLTITGDHAGLCLPGNHAIIQTGIVNDVRPLIAHSWISIVPLQVGGGTRLKILEAAALGTPVVSTTKGAEGMAFVNGRDIEIADTPLDFANRILWLLKDSKERERLALNSLELARRVYDWKVILPDFLGVVDLAAVRGKE